MKIREIFKKKGLKGEKIKKIKEQKEKQKKISEWWMKFKTHWKAWMVSFLILMLVTSIIVFPSNPSHELLLRYISSLAIWPLIILILGLVLLLKYKGPISERIRTSLIKKGPSGWEVGPAIQAEAKPIEKAKIKELETKLKGEKTAKETFVQFALFERIIRNMYRSQFQFLKTLRKRRKMPIVEALRFYFAFLGAGGSKDYRPELYFNWLMIDNKLIDFKLENNEYFLKLTEKGESFIVYCYICKYSEKDFIPL